MIRYLNGGLTKPMQGPKCSVFEWLDKSCDFTIWIVDTQSVWYSNGYCTSYCLNTNTKIRKSKNQTCFCPVFKWHLFWRLALDAIFNVAIWIPDYLVWHSVAIWLVSWCHFGHNSKILTICQPNDFLQFEYRASPVFRCFCIWMLTTTQTNKQEDQRKERNSTY